MKAPEPEEKTSDGFTSGTFSKFLHLGEIPFPYGYLNGHRLGIAKGLRMAARIVSHSTRPIHDILERAKEFEEAKGG